MDIPAVITVKNRKNRWIVPCRAGQFPDGSIPFLIIRYRDIIQFCASLYSMKFPGIDAFILKIIFQTGVQFFQFCQFLFLHYPSLHFQR